MFFPEGPIFNRERERKFILEEGPDLSPREAGEFAVHDSEGNLILEGYKTTGWTFALPLEDELEQFALRLAQPHPEGIGSGLKAGDIITFYTNSDPESYEVYDIYRELGITRGSQRKKSAGQRAWRWLTTLDPGPQQSSNVRVRPLRRFNPYGYNPDYRWNPCPTCGF